MHGGRAREDVAGQEPGAAVPVGDDAAGLAISSPPAATSHGASPSSKNPSNTPQAVQARSRQAAPGRRRSSNAIQRQLHRRQVARQPILAPEREPGGHDRAARAHARSRRTASTRRPGAPTRPRPRAPRASSRPGTAPRSPRRPGARPPPAPPRPPRPRSRAGSSWCRPAGRPPSAGPPSLPAELLALDRDLGRLAGQERRDRPLAREVDLGDPVPGQPLGRPGARRPAGAHHLRAGQRRRRAPPSRIRARSIAHATISATLHDTSKRRQARWSLRSRG